MLNFRQNNDNSSNSGMVILYKMFMTHFKFFKGSIDKNHSKKKHLRALADHFNK